MFGLGLIISHYWGKIFLSTLCSALRIWGFSVWLSKIDNIPGLIWVLGTFSPNLFGLFFPFSEACIGQYSAECSMRTIYRYPGFFASTALSFLIFCPVNSKYPGQLNFLSSRSFLGSAQVPLPLYHGLEILSRQYTEAVVGRAYLMCFPSCRDHCPSLPDVQFLGNFFSYLLPFVLFFFLV